jgi:predicted nucleic acid-binding protein
LEFGSKKDALIRISQFVIRKESEAFARDCQVGLIKTILFNVGNTGLSASGIVEEVHKQMGLKNFPTSIIQSVVDEASAKNMEIYEKNSEYFLENEEFEKMKKIIIERKRLINSFESALKGKMQEKTKKLQSATDAAETALQVLYDFMVTWFSSESNFIANLLRTKKQIGLPDFPLKILDEILKKVANVELRQVIRDSMLETFKDLETDLGKLLYELIQNYVHLELLNLDPECRHLQKIAFSKKTFVLDTNILMALLLEGHPSHEAICDIISITGDLNVNLVMTKRTEIEWLWSLERANEQFQTVRSKRPSLLPSLDDVFIQSYFKMYASTPSITWQGFYLQMRQVKSLVKEKRVNYWYKKEFELENLPNKDFFEPLVGRVYYCSMARGGEPKRKEVSEHDAYHILLVRKLRDENGPDILGPSCWFFTLDTTLICADEGLNQFLKNPFDSPSSFLADMWIPIIGHFLGPEVPESRLADAFARLMKTHFATMPSSINGNALVEVLGDWLAYKSLSDNDIEGY